jgi:hypothetical protein
MASGESPVTEAEVTVSGRLEDALRTWALTHMRLNGISPDVLMGALAVVTADMLTFASAQRGPQEAAAHHVLDTAILPILHNRIAKEFTSVRAGLERELRAERRH